MQNHGGPRKKQADEADARRLTKQVGAHRFLAIASVVPQEGEWCREQSLRAGRLLAVRGRCSPLAAHAGDRAKFHLPSYECAEERIELRQAEFAINVLVVRVHHPCSAFEGPKFEVVQHITELR